MKQGVISLCVLVTAHHASVAFANCEIRADSSGAAVAAAAGRDVNIRVENAEFPLTCDVGAVQNALEDGHEKIELRMNAKFRQLVLSGKSQSAALDQIRQTLQGVIDGLQDDKEQYQHIESLNSALAAKLDELLRRAQPDLALRFDIPELSRCSALPDSPERPCIDLVSSVPSIVTIEGVVGSLLGATTLKLQTLVFSCKSTPVLVDAVYDLRSGKQVGGSWVEVQPRTASIASDHDVIASVAFRSGSSCEHVEVTATGLTSQGARAVGYSEFTIKASDLVYSTLDADGATLRLRRVSILPFVGVGRAWSSNGDELMGSLRRLDAQSAVRFGRQAKAFVLAIRPRAAPPEWYARLVSSLQWDRWAYQAFAVENRLARDEYCVQIAAALSQFLSRVGFVPAWTFRCDQTMKNLMGKVEQKGLPMPDLRWEGGAKVVTPPEIGDSFTDEEIYDVALHSPNSGVSYPVDVERDFTPNLLILGGPGLAFSWPSDQKLTAIPELGVYFPVLWGYAVIGGVRTGKLWAAELGSNDLLSVFFPSDSLITDVGVFFGANKSGDREVGGSMLVGFRALSHRLRYERALGPKTQRNGGSERPSVDIGLLTRVGTSSMSASLVVRLGMLFENVERGDY